MAHGFLAKLLIFSLWNFYHIINLQIMDNFPFVKILFIIIYRSSQPLIITYQTQNENHRDFIKYFTFFFGFSLPICPNNNWQYWQPISVNFFFCLHFQNWSWCICWGVRWRSHKWIHIWKDSTYGTTQWDAQRNACLWKTQRKNGKEKKLGFFFSTSSSFRNISTQFMMS